MRETATMETAGPTPATAAIANLFGKPAQIAEAPTHERPAQSDKDVLRRRVKDEARSLFRLVGEKGETARSIRDQIYIPPHIARDLFAFIERHPDDAQWVLGAMEFRNRVLREFDILTSSAEHAERVAAAEEEAAHRAAAEIPVLPLLQELVVSAGG